jgi:hypothetical protein
LTGTSPCKFISFVFTERDGRKGPPGKLATGLLLLDKNPQLNVVFVELTDLEGDAAANNICNKMIDALQTRCCLSLESIAQKLV